MEFRETLLAAQRNQKQKSSSNSYYKARFDPPKKEHKPRDKLSANIQKFLAKKEEEEKLKKLEEKRKREELHAMRDPKALRKIQKTLKVIKSANKSVLQDAIDLDNTAVTMQGPEQPDQDDYGYESQEAAALYAKMMQKYSKIPEEPKFPVSNGRVKKDLNSTRERVKHALQHEDDPVPHKRKRKTEHGERNSSPPAKYEPEKKKDEKPEKPKVRKPAPPPMDFNQLLKLAEQKKNDPLATAAVKKVDKEAEPERLMTKKQKQEYEEEMERRRRRQERIDAEKGGGRKTRDDRLAERDKKPEATQTGFGRIPKLGDKANKTDSSKSLDREKERFEREKERFDREKERYVKEKERYDRERMQKEKDRTKEREISEREKAEREQLKADRERLDRLKAERDRIDREMERLNKDKERLDKTKSRIETKVVDRKPLDKLDRSKLMSRETLRPEAKKSIDLKSQNTFRIDKNSNERKVPSMNGHTSTKQVPKASVQQRDTKDALGKPRSDGSTQPNGRRPENGKHIDRVGDKGHAGSSKGKLSNSFDFDQHVNALKNGGRQFPPGHVKRKPQLDDKKKLKRRLQSDSEYDSEMDDFIDDGDENLDYSSHIKEIFGYDRSKYRDLDDDDDPNMESNFVQQQREEYISKKHGILEDLEDMRLEALEKKKKGKSKRRLSDDD